MKDAHITIRKACLNDIPALSALVLASVRGLSTQHYTEQQVESAIKHHYVGVDTQLIEDGTFFVAESEDVVVGCGGWSQRRLIAGGDGIKQTGEEDDLLHPDTDAARIRAFFVHPDWVRRGIGRALMQESEAAARAAGFRRMELWATHTGVPLYQSHGFQATGNVEMTLPDGITVLGVYMEKILDTRPAE